MCTNKECKVHQGFSLIELLLVIFIVSLVYALGISNIDFKKPTPKPLTILNLKSSIQKSEWFSGHAMLLCINKCKDCFLRNDVGSPFQAYKSKIDLKDIEAYTIDASDSLVQIEYERFKDKKICLEMDFYNNGSSTQLILKNKKATYFLPSFFGEAKKFDSPEDAKEYWLEKSNRIANSGEYY